MRAHILGVALLSFAGLSACVAGRETGGDKALPNPVVVDSEFVGPFTGADAPLDPANIGLDRKTGYYGTDLGWSYQHGGKIHFMFGDTWSSENYAPVNGAESPEYDDIMGTVSLSQWPNGKSIGHGKVPTVAIVQNPDTGALLTFNPGHVMDLGKTPVGGFSDGSSEYGLFFTLKGASCHADADCPGSLKCNMNLGSVGAPLASQEGTTFACMRGSLFCLAPEKAGICADPGASTAGQSAAGQVASAGMSLRFGRRSPQHPEKYADIHKWLTTRFLNSAIRAVSSFDPERGKGDYTAPSGDSRKPVIFYFGRPTFIGVKSAGRPASLYFAWSSIPERGEPWVRHYYQGMNPNGMPIFGEDESLALPVRVDGEEIDVINQMSVVWIDRIKKWMMVYGGGITQIKQPALSQCGLLQLFAGADCDQVDVRDQSMVVRFADQPWGPWSPSQIMLKVEGPQQGATGQYAPGGSLHHPDCKETGCAPHSQTYNYDQNEYGFLYGANIIEPWTIIDRKEMTIFWNASTWDPYRVGLYKTRFRLPTE